MSEGITVCLNELVKLKQRIHSQAESVLARAQQPGHRLSRLKGRGMDFAETRHYQAGDEIRHMDWRVTARTGKPHVKLYQQERERPVIVLADFNPSLFFGTRVALKSVVVAKVAALIAWRAVKAGDRVGALLVASNGYHQELPPKSRDKGILPLLAGLCAFSELQTQTDKPTRLSDALVKIRRVAKPGSLITIISDFYQLDEACERHLKRLKQHNEVMMYAISDPIEQRLPQKGCYGITDGEHQLLLDTTQEPVMKAFYRQQHQRSQTLRNLCQATRIDCHLIQTTDDYAAIVGQSLQGRRYG